MPKYYVAGIPFDSEDCLRHDGVKGMKWGQHIFGPDANTKYINWMKDIGKFANNAANTVSNAATSAARAVGGALNKSANFVTGNQAKQNLNNAKANVANVQSGRSKVNDAYARYDQLRNSEAQHRTAANGWRESQANRAPLENFGRTQDGINADNEDRRAKQDANRAEIAKMKADRMAERQRNAETQARAEAKNAQQAYDRTLPGAAENAARGAQGFINSAGKWVSTAANDAKNWAGNAVNDVGKAANQAGQWVSETAQKAWDSPWVNPEKAVNVAGQWIGDRATDVGKAATNAYNDVSKAVSGNGVEADVSDRIAKKYGLNSIADVMSMDRETAEKMLQEYDAEVSKAKDNSLFGRIGNAANSVGNWVGGAYNDAKEWTGNAVNDVGSAVNQAGQWIGDRAQDVGNAANQAGQWIGDRAQDVGNAANQVWNGVTDAANQAGDWIGDRANDVGKAAGSAVNAVGNAANDAGQWIGDRARDVGNWFTGGDKGQQAADLREQARALQERGDAMVDQGTKGISDSIYAEPPVNMSPDNSAYAQRAKDNSEAMFRKGLSTRNQGYDLQDDAYALRNQAAHLQSAYDAAPGQQLRAGAEAVGNAASNAVNWVGDRAREAGNAIGNAANGIRDWGGQAIKDAGSFLSEMTNPHYQLDAERLMENYRNYLNEHPENLQSPKHEEWLKEQIKNDPQLREYYESMMKHSDISDKPEGVGEAFWKNYIAHGGTREDYEREWR